MPKSTKTPTERRMQLARSNLVLEEPFFGHLALQMDMFEDPTCETAWTDGSRIAWNPEYVGKLDLDHCIGLVCHEIFHCVLGHPWRRGFREHKKWNIACDFAVDKPIVDSGKKVPDKMIDPQFADKSAEWIYSRLPDMPAGGQGQGGGPPRGCGEVRDAPLPATGVRSHAEFKNLVKQAANEAKRQGLLPGSLEYLVDADDEGIMDWPAILRMLIQQSFSAQDYTWKLPNRRYMPLGVYLPSLQGEEMPKIAMAIDTSGSITDPELNSFISETQAVIDECQPEATYLIPCDADVRPGDVREVPRGEDLGKVKITGRGGTDFRPVFDYVEKEGLDIACLIYQTDMYGTFPDKKPDYPVIWISTSQGITAPFGDTLYMLDGGIQQ